MTYYGMILNCYVTKKPYRSAEDGRGMAMSGQIPRVLYFYDARFPRSTQWRPSRRSRAHSAGPGPG